jgi:preprotein translocase subunit SecE
MADVKNRAVTEGADEAPPPRRAFNPVRFWNEVVREMKKVTWPSWKETYLTTIMVLIFSGLTMVFFFAVDSALQYAQYLLIGARRLF